MKLDFLYVDARVKQVPCRAEKQDIYDKHISTDFGFVS